MGRLSGNRNGGMISGPPIAARQILGARLSEYALGRRPGARGLEISKKRALGPIRRVGAIFLRVVATGR